MAMKELFELSSVLQGDDREKNELERKKSILSSAIKQQEDKVLEDLFDAKIVVHRDYEEVLDIVERESEKVDCSLHQGSILHETLVTFPVKILGENFASYISAADDFRKDLEVVKRKLLKMESELAHADDIDMFAESNILTQLRTDASNSSQVVQQLESEKNDVIKEETELNASFCRVNDVLFETVTRKLDAKEQFRISAIRLVQVTKELEMEQCSAHAIVTARHEAQELSSRAMFEQDRQISELRQKQSAVVDDLSAKSLKIHQLQEQLQTQTDTLAKVQEETSAATAENVNMRNRIEECEQDLASRERIFCEHDNQLQVLRRQREANAYCSFASKLDQLSEETKSAHVVQSELRSNIENLKKELDPNSGSVFAQALRLVHESLERKRTILNELQDSNENIRVCLDENKLLQIQASFTESECDRLRQHLQALITEEKSVESEVCNDKEKLARMEGEQSIHQNSLLSQSISDDIQQLHTLVKEKEQFLAELCLKRKQFENDRKIQEEVIRLQNINQVKSSRLMELRKKRILLHQQAIQTMEEALMKEDEVFQHNVVASQNLLNAKKKQLADELENILSLAHDRQEPFEEHKKKSSPSEVPPSPILDHEPRRKSSSFKRKISSDKMLENTNAQESQIRKPRAKMRAGLSISSWHPNK